MPEQGIGAPVSARRRGAPSWSLVGRGRHTRSRRYCLPSDHNLVPSTTAKLAKAANAGGCCQPDFSRIGRIASFCANTPWCHSLGPKQSPMPTEGAGGETGSGCFRTVQHGGYTCGGLLQPVVGEVGIALGHGNVLVPENSALESLVLL